MKTLLSPTACALAAALFVAGCADTGGIRSTHAPLSVTATAADNAGWPDPAKDGNAWSTWNDAQLDALIATALKGQPSLQVVLLRVQQAEAQADLAGAARSPQVQLSAESQREHLSENGFYPPPFGGITIWNHTLQFEGSWELDFFGKQRNAVAAAVGQERAAQAEAQAAGMLLAANVANTYVALAHAFEQRGIARQALAEREQVVAIVRDRVAGGLDSKVEQAQADGVVAQTRAELAAADEQIARGRHALAELTGQRPDALDSLQPALEPLKAQALPAGLPLDLIGRRADVVAQRWRVEATLRNVDSARAEFYPNINIAGVIGLNAKKMTHLFEAGSLEYAVGPALHLPIFEGGKLRANLKGKAAEADIAIENYNATLLKALREAADEASSLKAIEAQQKDQAAALQAAETAFALSTERYKAGLGNFLVVLTAESNVLAQRRSAAELKARHLQSEISLSKSLGGGVHADGPTEVAQGNLQ